MSGRAYLSATSPPNSNAWNLFIAPPLEASGPVVSTGLIRLTSTFREFQVEPAVSSDERLLAFIQGDVEGTYNQVMIMDLANPAKTPLLVSASAGFALSPTWCGTDLYYSYNTTLSYPYTLYRWDAVARTTSVVSAFTRRNVLGASFAQTSVDGLFTCPR